MSAWKEFKKSLGNTPLALLSSKNIVSEEISKQRMDTCLNCEHLIKITKQCSKCGCFMETKTTLKGSFCPIGKWSALPEEELNKN